MTPGPGTTGAGRYAPSPTGRLHLGNLRTALVAWLAARHGGQEFLLRIEDLDSGRSRERWVDVQVGELERLGLDWDGTPVRQSGRHELYEEALGELRRQGLVYECFCTRAEIREASSAPHGPLPEGFYPGTCANLSGPELAERRRSGRPPALRVRAGGETVVFRDRIHGVCSGPIDDFVVRRNDGDYGYNLAVVVDDAAQGVTEVVRGDDLLDSTPRQLWLGARLALDVPASYAHLPLMLGADGARLAKRHGAVTLEEQLESGRTVPAVVGELAASLGLAEPGTDAVPADLVAGFSWDRLPDPA